MIHNEAETGSKSGFRHEFDRRGFIKTTVATVCCFSVIDVYARSVKLPGRQSIRKDFFVIQPFDSVGSSPSFIRLCRRGRFSSFESAVTAVRNPNVRFLVKKITAGV